MDLVVLAGFAVVVLAGAVVVLVGLVVVTGVLAGAVDAAGVLAGADVEKVCGLGAGVLEGAACDGCIGGTSPGGAVTPDWGI